VKDEGAADQYRCGAAALTERQRLGASVRESMQDQRRDDDGAVGALVRSVVAALEKE
jgi:hypothetical protein